MPNWVKQRFIALDMQAVREAILDENGRMDFNRVIPMPAELDGQPTFDWEEIDKFGFGGENFKVKKSFQDTTFKPFLHSVIKDEHNRDEFIKAVKKELKKKENKSLLNQVCDIYNIEDIDEEPKMHDVIGIMNPTFIRVVGGYYNIMRYGYKDWYDWSIENWGTKWNACDCFDNGDYIEFETAWSLPHPVYAKLAEITPIRVVYADEDLGSNCGLVDFYKDKDGDICFNQLMEESTELAYDTWGYSHITAYDEDWNEIEDENDQRYIDANKNYFAIQEEINTLMNIDNFQKDLVEV